MKIVVIRVPNIISDAEIYEALQIMASHIAVPEHAEGLMSADILPERSKNINPMVEIQKKCDKILQLCMDPNKIATITNFWSNITNGKITKGMLLEIMRCPTVAKAYLQKCNASCFYNLFENALKHL